MKKLILTGLANEHSFVDISSGALGETSFFLVFNGGELRLPTSKEGARQALEFMSSEDGGVTEQTGFQEEGGMEEEPYPVPPPERGLGDSDQDNQTDEDGVASV